MARPKGSGGSHRLRKSSAGSGFELDIEMARRGLTIVATAQRAGVSTNTIQRLRGRIPADRGEATTLPTAYKIARGVDPADPDSMLERLFWQDAPPG